MRRFTLFTFMLIACLVGCNQKDSSINLSQNGTANCYIVSEAGVYSFLTTKGNSSENVGEVKMAEVLWESLGTEEVPDIGDLISNVAYKNGYIEFETNKSFKKGNALIAAKDKSGTILWSWHIWFTDEPQQQMYHYEGTMMDRDLGAVSSTGGEGLIYQWGRKDPFCGRHVFCTSESQCEMYNYEIGTINYATEHPTTVIGTKLDEYTYLHHGIWCRDETKTLWNESKSIYDPCPVGWRIPDEDIWKKSIKHRLSEDCTDGHRFTVKSGCGNSIYYPWNHYWSTRPYFDTCFQVWFWEEYDEYAEERVCDDCDAIGTEAHVRCQKES